MGDTPSNAFLMLQRKVDNYVLPPCIPHRTHIPSVSPHISYLPQPICPPEIHQHHRVWHTSLSGGEKPGELGCGGI